MGFGPAVLPSLGSGWVHRNSGLVQKLHFNGKVHTALRYLASQPLLTQSSAGTLSPHPPCCPYPSLRPLLAERSLPRGWGMGEWGGCWLLHRTYPVGHREAAPQATEPSRLSLSTVTSTELGMSTPGDRALTSCSTPSASS